MLEHADTVITATDSLVTVVVTGTLVFVVNMVALMIGVWLWRPVITIEVEDEKDYPFI